MVGDSTNNLAVGEPDMSGDVPCPYTSVARRGHRSQQQFNIDRGSHHRKIAQRGPFEGYRKVSMNGKVLTLGIQGDRSVREEGGIVTRNHTSRLPVHGHDFSA